MTTEQSHHDKAYVGLLTLEALVFRRLLEMKRHGGRGEDIIRFPIVFSRVCPPYSLKKRHAWTILVALGKKGYLEVVPFHGIRLRRRAHGCDSSCRRRIPCQGLEPRTY